MSVLVDLPERLREFGRGYLLSLLVDGAGPVDGEDVVVTPTGAVLHKPVS